MSESLSFQDEIDNGRNIHNVKCKFCATIILTAGSGSYQTSEFELPLMQQNKHETNPKTELITDFWSVPDMYTFNNVGYSNTVGNNKFLTCGECEAGPIGYYDIPSECSYVALSRVDHN